MQKVEGCLDTLLLSCMRFHDKYCLADYACQHRGVAGIEAGRCVDQYDAVAVNRGLLSAIAPETTTALLNAVDKGELSMIGYVGRFTVPRRN